MRPQDLNPGCKPYINLSYTTTKNDKLKNLKFKYGLKLTTSKKN